MGQLEELHRGVGAPAPQHRVGVLAQVDVVADGMPWSSAAMRVETDGAAAERLLDEARWQQGDDGMRSRDGVPLASHTQVAAPSGATPVWVASSHWAAW